MPLTSSIGYDGSTGLQDRPVAALGVAGPPVSSTYDAHQDYFSSVLFCHRILCNEVQNIVDLKNQRMNHCGID